jgi:hypothetical protein
MLRLDRAVVPARSREQVRFLNEALFFTVICIWSHSDDSGDGK